MKKQLIEIEKLIRYYESKTKSERIKTAIFHTKMQGKCTHKAPFGYENKQCGNNKFVEINIEKS